jgi:endogenous inhibitor of DNA gyrase (YacG/DUF329 family)
MPRTTPLLENQTIYDGYVFTKDKKTGYYLSAKPIINGKRIMLHRYVWIKFNGEIPAGTSVHHIDENKDNNNISNLVLMSTSKHLSFHATNKIKNNYEDAKQKFLDRTQEKAKKWHRSEEGKQWHREHAKATIAKEDALARTKDAVCAVCGSEYKTTESKANTARFCSKKCKAKYRRIMHLDDIEKQCVICGKKFMSNKYKNVFTCGKQCKLVFWKERRNQKE